MARNWKAGPNRIIVLQKLTEKTAGGIYLTDSNKLQEPREGVVISVGKLWEHRGSGNIQDNPFVELDDIVMFGEYAGTPVAVPGHEDRILRVLAMEDILSIHSHKDG